MQHIRQIGITGGIGSGKSLVCRIFQILGVPIYDADSRAKKLMTTDGILIDQIKKEFGTLSYHPDGELNREYISANVFGNPDRLKQLNELVHPRVAIDYEQWVQSHVGERYVIKEAALLFESGSYKMLDEVILVTAPEELRVQRVVARDTHRTKNDITKIIKNQLPEEAKAMKAQYILRNDEQELMVPQVLKLHERFNSFK
jgi:dephospho-CoA kinase